MCQYQKWEIDLVSWANWQRFDFSLLDSLSRNV